MSRGAPDVLIRDCADLARGLAVAVRFVRDHPTGHQDPRNGVVYAPVDGSAEGLLCYRTPRGMVVVRGEVPR